MRVQNFMFENVLFLLCTIETIYYFLSSFIEHIVCYTIHAYYIKFCFIASYARPLSPYYFHSFYAFFNQILSLKIYYRYC